MRTYNQNEVFSRRWVVYQFGWLLWGAASTGGDTALTETSPASRSSYSEVIWPSRDRELLLSLCPWYNVYILEIETNKLVSAFGKRTCVRVYGRKFGLAPDPAHLHTQLLIPVQCPLSLPRALSEPQRRHFLYSDSVKWVMFQNALVPVG